MEQIQSTILTSIAVTLIEVLLPVILGMLVGFINEKIKEVKASRYAAQFEQAEALIFRLVMAAEQNGVRGALEAEGKAKKAFVIEKAEAELAKKGIHLDLDVIDALVEGAVHEAFTQIEIPAAPEG